MNLGGLPVMASAHLISLVLFFKTKRQNQGETQDIWVKIKYYTACSRRASPY